MRDALAELIEFSIGVLAAAFLFITGAVLVAEPEVTTQAATPSTSSFLTASVVNGCYGVLPGGALATANEDPYVLSAAVSLVEGEITPEAYGVLAYYFDANQNAVACLLDWAEPSA